MNESHRTRKLHLGTLRHSRQRRLAGMHKPWTEDPILRSYRFCNVYREHDTETIWIAQNWRNPNTNDPNVWFAMAVARLRELVAFARSYRLSGAVGRQEVRYALDYRAQFGEKVYTGAYIIPPGVWLQEQSRVPRQGTVHTTLGSSVTTFSRSTYQLRRTSTNVCTEFKGMGSFLAGQIVCDTKYTRLLDTSLDWWEFAVEGAGKQAWLESCLRSPGESELEEGRLVVQADGVEGSHLPHH